MSIKAKNFVEGFFGNYGGSFVPEPVVPVLEELKEAYNKYKDDYEFIETVE